MVSVPVGFGSPAGQPVGKVRRLAPEGFEARDDRFRIGQSDDHSRALAQSAERVPRKPDVPIDDQEAVMHGRHLTTEHANLRSRRKDFESFVQSSPE